MINNQIQTQTSYSIKKVFFRLTLIALLFVAGLVVPAINVVVLIYCLYLIMTCDTDEIIMFMAFIVQFEGIFKYNITGFALYNFLPLSALLIVCIRRRRIVFSNRFLFTAVFCAYSVFVSMFNGLTDALKAAVSFVFILFVYSDPESKKPKFEDLIHVFSYGIIITTVLGLFTEYFPRLGILMAQARVRLAGRVFYYRFAGIAYNPNMYSVLLNIVIAALIVIILQKKAKLIDYLLIAAFTVFGMMSISKSFVVTFVIVALLAVIVSSRSPRRLFAILGIAAVVGLVIYFVVDKNLIKAIIYRFTAESDAADFNNATTGRSDIWLAYIREMLNNPVKLIFGNGIGASRAVGKETHSFYLELLYYFGITGTVLFTAHIKKLFDIRFNLRSRDWFTRALPLAALLIRFFARNLYANDLLVYLFLIASMSLCSTSVNEGGASVHETGRV